MTESTLTIAPLDAKNPEALWVLIEKFGFSRDRDYYERSLERYNLGELVIVAAALDKELVGYCLLNWVPKYSYFKAHDMPEIQDLNVLPIHRNHGIGTALIQHCEALALSEKKLIMGIGVGLDRSFGPAQRLYIKLGYIPDGNGICYDRMLLSVGEFRPIDENLCLMMTKSLINQMQRP